MVQSLGTIGKRDRGMVLGQRIPQFIMTCLTALSTCIRPTITTRPTAQIAIGKTKLMALFDTGSAVTLCDSSIKVSLSANPQEIPLNTLPQLHSANGGPLAVTSAIMLNITLPNHRSYRHPVIFVENLQVPCILGMDFMRKARVLIDTANGKIRLAKDEEDIRLPGHRKPTTAPATSPTDTILSCSQDVTIQPMEEAKVTCTTDQPFTTALCTSLEMLDPNCHVMDGVIASIIGKPRVCNVVAINHGHTPIFIPKSTPIATFTPLSPHEFSPVSEVFNINHGEVTMTNIDHVKTISLDHLPEIYRPRYKSLLYSFADVFSRHDQDVGHCKTLPHKVRLNDPNKVVSVNQYRLPYHLKEVAIDYVEKLLRSGVIRPSTSVFNSPLMLVKKPNADPTKPLGEQYRLVHNYIELNKLITPCSYPLRHLYELLDEVASGKVFSVLDLSQGFFQQTLIDPLETTSFSIPGYGQFTYNRSPQGLNSSPAYFQRLLDFVVNGIKGCYVYIDDVVISAKDHEENLTILHQVYSRFRQHNLKIKPSKCHLGTGSISYLGYEITAGKGIQPGLAKTLTVKNFPEPRTIKDIRSFIGLTSFFRRAIRDYSLISGPLNRLVRKDSGYKSGILPAPARQAFQQLKLALISRPCLAPVDFSQRFIITTDASETHYASCLSQKGPDGIERPCGYSSKLLSTKESKQQPGLRERAALLHALRHWQPYLIGKEFLMRTDHNPNLALAKGKMKSYDTLTDEILQYMPFKMEFLNGNKMFVDALSRPSINAVDLGMGPTLKSPFDEQIIKNAQLADKELVNHFARHKNIPTSQFFPVSKLQVSTHLYNDLLCTFDKTGSRQFIAPKSLRPLLLYLCHDQGGHLSAKYTSDRLKENWFWPDMLTDTANFCKSCDTCAKSKPPSQYTRMPLEIMSPAAQVFGDRIHIDMLSMPTSSDGHVAILTAVDAATGFIFAKPCLDKTSHNVVDLVLNTIIPFFGCPKVIVTDLGVENKNAEVAQLLNNFLIEHRFSSRSHPQSNGMVERRQRMLLNFARLYSDSFQNQNLWHLRLPMCQLLLNSTKSISRNFTPFFLTYFRHARLPYSVMLNARQNLNEDSRVAGHLRMANRVIKLAHDEVLRNSQKNINWHNNHRVHVRSFPIGSKLFVMTSQRDKISYKLANKWKGPYICLQHLEHNNLLVKLIAGRKVEKVHKNLCKPADFRLEHLRVDDTHPLLTSSPDTPRDANVPQTRPPVNEILPTDEDEHLIEPRVPDPIPPIPAPAPQLPNPPAAAGPRRARAEFPAIDPNPRRTRADNLRAGIQVPNIRYQRVRLETELRRERQDAADLRELEQIEEPDLEGEESESSDD